jgi:hypothetical protein
MTNNSSKKNLFLEHDPLCRSSEMEAFFYSNPIDPIVDAEDGEEGGGAGTVTLSVDQLFAYLQALFKKVRRQRDGQGKFGICPISEDPNSLLGKKNSPECGFGESPQLHPLLSRTQQFSGIDDKLTPIPAENSEASKQFPEKRLENHLRKQKKLGLGASKSVTLAR